MRAMILTALVLLAAGCGAPGPMEGPELEHLKGQVRSAKPDAVVVSAIGPRGLLDGGPEAEIVMPYVVHGDKITEFALYDGYFKVAITAVDELRALGFEASVAPTVWKARADAIAFGMREHKVDDHQVDVALAGVNAQEEIQQLYLLKPQERREVLISKIVLISARTGLPAALRVKPRVTAREIRAAYFDREAAPLEVRIEAIELDTKAEEASFSATREGRARLGFTLLRGRKEVFSGEFACRDVREGTSVTFVPKGASYTVDATAVDPLDRAIRGSVRAFAAAALPVLRGER
jgi:hypothetical protein